MLLSPLISTIFIQFSKKLNEVLFISLCFSIFNLIQSLILILLFDSASTASWQFLFTSNINDLQGWPSFDIFGSMGLIGLDGISLWLIWLVNMLMPIVILSTWKNIPQIQGRTLLYSYKLFITLCSFIFFWSIAVFLVLDLFLFYISFEGVLLPMYFLITFFGSRNNTKAIHASFMFFLYTLFGSLFLFLGLILLYVHTGSLDYQILQTIPISTSIQPILWIAFFLAFCIKLPQVPLHLWLLVAHTESHTVGSVILAAILLKLGSYGLLRYSLTLFPQATLFFTPLVFTIAIISIFYSSIAALSQIDMKLIIAYSSIGHIGTTVLGLFSQDLLGIQAAVYFMISHGLISSALFFLVGMLYERFHTRTLIYYRGLVQVYPIYVLFLLFFSMANAGFPLTSGFIGEFFALVGIFHYNPFIALMAAFSSFFYVESFASY